MICDLSTGGITLGTAGVAVMFRKGPLTVRRIQSEVADYYELLPEVMVSAQRFRSVAHPRQLAMYLASQMTHHSLSAIGRFFGNRDHTTVMYAVFEVEKRLKSDQRLAKDCAILRERLAA